MSWRDTIKVHPAADLFPLLGDAELRELADDIKANGLHEKVKIILKPRLGSDGLYHVGKHDQIVIDGRNRLDAMELAGIPMFRRGTTDFNPDVAEVVEEIETDSDVVEYVIGVNVHRRHLTGEQKRDVIAKLLRAKPERSNLQTAKIVGVDDKTVASVRREMAARSEIPDVTETVDTKGRRQPTRKAKATRPNLDPAEARARVEALADLVKSHLQDEATKKPKTKPAVTINGEPATAAATAPSTEADPQIDAATLSPSAQEKLQAAIRQHKRKLDQEFETRVLAEIKTRIDAVVLPSYREQAAMHDMIIKSRKGIMDKATYRLIWSCLHADSRKSVSGDRLNKAFHVWTDIELLLLDEKQSPTPAFDMPATYADLMERKRKVAESRKAKRGRQAKAEAAPTASDPPAKARAKAAWRENPNATKREIEKLAGVGSKVVMQARRELEEAGEIAPPQRSRRQGTSLAPETKVTKASDARCAEITKGLNDRLRRGFR
jgi:hypothetical protein